MPEAPAPTLEEIARTLAAAARDVRQHVAAPQPPALPPPATRVTVTASTVRRVIAARRLRESYFPGVPGDAVFAMLLELFAARLEGRRVPQSGLASLAGVPHASGIRITRALLADGVFTAADDPSDRRLILLGLSDEAAARMEAYLSVAIAAMPVLL
jgi:hypothetical protein